MTSSRKLLTTLCSVRRSSTRSVIAGVVAVAGVLLAACGGDDSSSTSSAAHSSAAAASTAGATPQGTITVFAASSLTAAFGEIGTAFMAAHPGAKVTFSFDASSSLAAQITQGAPADVFASADTTNMDKLTSKGLTEGAPVPFATNSLAIIVPAGNPKGVASVADLANGDLKVVLCAAEVPCGKYAKQLLDGAKVAVEPVSLEQNVKGVVTKVTTGVADAGIVYVTDVIAAGAKATAVAIPDAQNVIARYPIAVVKQTAHADLAAAFVDYVTSAAGQAILSKRGFSAP